MNISELRIIVFLFQTESFIEEKSMLSVLAALTALLESITWPAITSGRLTALLLLLFFVILTALESRIPKMKLAPKGLWLSYRTNIMLFIFNGAVLSLACRLPPVSMLAQHDSGPWLAQLFLKPGMASLFVVFIARFVIVGHGTKPVTVLMFSGCFTIVHSRRCLG